MARKPRSRQTWVDTSLESKVGRKGFIDDPDRVLTVDQHLIKNRFDLLRVSVVSENNGNMLFLAMTVMVIWDVLWVNSRLSNVSQFRSGTLGRTSSCCRAAAIRSAISFRSTSGGSQENGLLVGEYMGAFLQRLAEVIQHGLLISAYRVSYIQGEVQRLAARGGSS